MIDAKGGARDDGQGGPKRELLYRSLFENMLEGGAYCKMIFEQDVPRDFVYLEVNSAFERLTGLKNVAGKKVTEVIPGIRESNPDVFEIYGRVSSTGTPERFELHLGPLNAWLSVSVYSPEKGFFVATFDNITERKRAEMERETTIAFLRLVNDSKSTADLVRSATTFFKQQSGCEAVGIRLREGEDYPYFEAHGFAREFVQMENSLCARNSDGSPARDSAGNPVMECMCGNVICGRFDASREFFTAHGSFWTNSTTELLRNTTDADRQARTRNRCNGEGYESVALIPLVVGSERLGLLQLNDRRKDVFTAEAIGLWERMADKLAVALAKFRNEEALRQSEARFSKVFHSSPIAIVISRLSDGRFFAVNEAFLNVYRYKPEDIAGRTSLELKLWAHPEQRERMVTVLRDGGRVRNFEAKHRKSNGEMIDLFISSEPIELAGEPYLLSMFTDITERKQVETQLRESEKNYRSLVDNAMVGIYRSTLTGTFLYTNEAMARIFEAGSANELVGQDVLQRWKDPKDRTKYLEHLKRDGTISNYEIEATAKSGKQLNLLMNAVLDGDTISGMVLDITDKKKLEQQLLQAQKMEAVGQLTSGIAHDFNNILSAIVGYASLLQLKMPRNQPGRPFVDEILATTDRAANLTRSLLTFSRKQKTTLTAIDLNEKIGYVEKMLRRIIGEDIDLRTSLAPGALIVNGDSGQLEQILMNLATNARDAMQHGGILTIETEVVDSAALTGLPECTAPRYALVSVTDTGVGMDEKTRERIFEPFFTTKDLGRGTGLGLSMVYGIIKEHNGFIQCDSELSLGSTFRIYLPLLSQSRAEETTDITAVTADENFRGSEAILVVEDDEALNSLTKKMLEAYGYTVIDASNGREALQQYRMHREEISLVLSDVIMPGMNGAEVKEAIARFSSSLPFIFMTGYSADIINKKSMLQESTDIIGKPFSPAKLLKKVREVLDRKR